ncbi:MAG: hypothetical protein ABL958_21395, partial [Bdellovibrionia bacterium]
MKYLLSFLLLTGLVLGSAPADAAKKKKSAPPTKTKPAKKPAKPKAPAPAATAAPTSAPEQPSGEEPSATPEPVTSAAPTLGAYATEMTEHVFRSLSQTLGATIHVAV